ncbi:MAG: GNAT family N-acetyltransferase [Chloroflexi bacterium]|nr:GNAT family N-acetyltransferase [Chloroflexota bacterium]
MTIYALSTLTDDHQLRVFLSTDTDYAAYALGDLEPPYDQHAQWVAASQKGAVEGLALLYTALDPPLLFLMGDVPALSAILMHGVGPDRIVFNARLEVEGVLDTFYDLQLVKTMLRMRVTSREFRPLSEEDDSGKPERLSGKDADAINSLHEVASEHDKRSMDDVAFVPAMVDQGVYFGIREDGQLIACAGTHLVAKRAKLAALGNVVVHPEQRRRGLGRRVTHAVARHLLDSEINLVVLNVEKRNAAAVKLYESLGFGTGTEYIEGIAARRS